MLRGKEKSFSSLGWLVGQQAGGEEGWRPALGMGGRWARAGGQGVAGGALPVFQQQGPQHVGSVLGLDLVRDDHLLHHLVGHARQGLLVQVQEHSPWNKDHRKRPSSPGKMQGRGWEGGRVGARAVK